MLVTCDRCKNWSNKCSPHMWSVVEGYTRATRHKAPTPIYKQEQGFLCPSCVVTLSAYPVNRLNTIVTREEKKKSEIKAIVSPWDIYH